jgi:5,6-dimethylbenzimidazole synthase
MDYESFLELMRHRRSIRRYKPDPVPDDFIMKILDAAHYAMSGANCQPWEFIVVKKPATKKKIFDEYLAHWERVWHLEQQRSLPYKHPNYQWSWEEKDAARSRIGWGDAPVYVVVLYDPRKQFGSVEITRMILNGTLLRSLGHLSMVIHLAAASLGLGSQRVDVSFQGPYREILGHREPIEVDCIVPVGYRAHEPGVPNRLPLEKLVHFERYEPQRYLRDGDLADYIQTTRKQA